MKLTLEISDIKTTRDAERKARALASSARMRIVRHLLVEGEKSTKEIAKFLKCSQQAVGRHMPILKKAGLVSCVRRDLLVRYYALSDEWYE